MLKEKKNTLKYNADRSLETCKARLVAKGYTQTYGVDYQETFAPVAKMNTARVLLSLAANLQWSLPQFDVKNAFLHGELKDKVYMEEPPRFTSELRTNVCRWKKALCGLKQSHCAWFGRFDNAMKSMGFRQSQGDHTFFINKSRFNRITILIVYIDDIIVTRDDLEEIQKLKKKLVEEFEVKDLGKLKYLLGIKVAYLFPNKYTLLTYDRRREC